MQAASKTTYWMGLLLALLASCGCDRDSKPNLVGQRAPDFTVQDSDRTVSLHDLHGKIIVLNFWATWCPPCVQEMPSLIAMQSQMKDRINVLAVSVDYDSDIYHRFLREHKVNLLTVRDPLKDEDISKIGGATRYGTTKLYGTNGYPETYIIDTHGVIRRKFIGPVEWTRPEIIAYLNGL